MQKKQTICLSVYGHADELNHGNSTQNEFRNNT